MTCCGNTVCVYQLLSIKNSAAKNYVKEKDFFLLICLTKKKYLLLQLLAILNFCNKEDVDAKICEGVMIKKNYFSW